MQRPDRDRDGHHQLPSDHLQASAQAPGEEQNLDSMAERGLRRLALRLSSTWGELTFAASTARATGANRPPCIRAVRTRHLGRMVVTQIPPRSLCHFEPSTTDAGALGADRSALSSDVHARELTPKAGIRFSRHKQTFMGLGIDDKQGDHSLSRR